MDGCEVVTRIVHEPTGVYHKAFERFMLAHGVALSKVNPRLARPFAEATGSLIKTDQAIIVSIPGLSTVTAFVLLIEMPELGELEDKAAAALSGLTPRNRQSGGWTGRACIAGGRAIVRRALYMPALVAIRFNPDLRIK